MPPCGLLSIEDALVQGESQAQLLILFLNPLMQ